MRTTACVLAPLCLLGAIHVAGACAPFGADGGGDGPAAREAAPEAGSALDAALADVTVADAGGGGDGFGGVRFEGPQGTGHRYLVVVKSAGVSWAEADADAVARGGYLATIRDEAENQFVFALASATPGAVYTAPDKNTFGPWLGGLLPVGWAEWRWVTDEAWSFTAWWPGEPSNSSGNEDRLHYYAFDKVESTWGDNPASGARVRSYVIERDD